jgi:predicted TIM-barrel fold metal-dependent hydrolase
VQSVIDIHIHIQPLHMFRPQALEMIKREDAKRKILYDNAARMFPR